MSNPARLTCVGILLCVGGSPLTWAQGGPNDAKRLNTLVCEIMNLSLEESPQSDFASTPWKEIAFTTPRPGWVYLCAEADLKPGDKVSIGIDAPSRAEAALVAGAQKETMRFVGGGEHRLRIWTEGRPALRRVVVRSIPEIFVYMVECLGKANEQACYSHTWDFLDRTILRDCNVVVSPPNDGYAELAAKWQKRGGKWFANQGMKELRNPAGDYFSYWQGILAKPMYDGVIHDELTDTDGDFYAKWAPALTRITEDPALYDKAIYLYCGWGSIADAGQEGLFTLDDRNASLGAKSLRCVPAPDGLATFRQGNIILDPKKEYTLSAYLKSEAPQTGAKPGDSGYRGTVFIINEGWYTSMGSIRTAPGASEWRRYSKTFKPVPSRDGKYQLVICSPAGGAMCVDAIQLEEGNQATAYQETKDLGAASTSRNLLVNGSFEQEWEGWGRKGKNVRFLMDLVSKTHTKLAPEAYMNEAPDEEAAQKAMTTRLGDVMAMWKAAHPGIEHRMTVILSAGNGALRYSNDKVPSASYKVLLDMEFHEIANRDAFTDLSGVGFWSMHYIDEELVRWYGALFRHYLIEGKKDRLTADPYVLTHIENPGFEDKETGWQFMPAEKDSLTIMPTAGLPRGSKYAPVPENKCALRMRRSDQKANTISQPIRGLTPGRLYSLKLYSAAPECKKVLTPVGIALDGVEVLNDKCYDRLWATEKVFWTMHYRVFRARSAEGKLTLSDWTDAPPTNRTPQEIVLDFIQIEPYFEEESRRD